MRATHELMAGVARPKLAIKNLFPPLLLVLCLTPSASAQKGVQTIDGVTFAERPDSLTVPVKQLAQALRWRTQGDGKAAQLRLNKRPVPASLTRRLVNGTVLVDLDALKKLGARVSYDKAKRRAKVQVRNRTLFVRKGLKRVVVNRTHQQLVAYQGAHVVLRSPVSTGKEGYATPSGTWHAKAYKVKMHRSRQYDNAPMPYSVQIVQGIFIHGGLVRKGQPLSHGCIRLPMNGPNAARWFYHWVERGTPVTIAGAWPKRLKGVR